MIGTKISHYQILEKLGEGGMGLIYKAEDEKLKRNVALKVLPESFTQDEASKIRFINEARAASALQHNNICTIHDIGETDSGQLFFVMDCYEGESLKEKISRGPMKLEEALDIAIQTAAGLSKAHEKAIVHRDIKPANIFVTNEGVVKILDFGVVKLAGAQTKLTKVDSTLGTVAYMSPEQARGEEIDERTDIWSLGVVMYEMTIGKLPFKGEYDQGVIYSILSEDPEPLTSLRTGIPMELERIINKILKKIPNERYHSTEDLIVDLKNLKQELESKEMKIHVALTAGAKRRTFSKTIVIPAVIVLAIVVAFILFRSFFVNEITEFKPIPIAVISFENQTGDKTYDRLQKVIPNLLITSLEQSKYFRVTTWERMRDLLKQIGKEDLEIIDPETGFQLCQRAGVDAIVLGSFTKLGEVFATDVKVLNVHTKEIIKSAQSQGKGESSIIETQIDELASEISKAAGIPDQKIVSTHKPIADVTTKSIDAYNCYLSGREERWRWNLTKARGFYERAVKLDSTFAMGYGELAMMYSFQYERKLQHAALSKAMKYLEKTTEKERLFIEALYAVYVELDFPKRINLLTRLTHYYPEDKYTRKELAGALMWSNQWERTIEEYKKVLELDPYDKESWNNLGLLYHKLKDDKKAVECLERYIALSPGEASPYYSMAEFYFDLGKFDEAMANYKKALELDPRDVETEFALSYLYAFKENYTEADNHLNQIILRENSPGIVAQGYFLKGFYAYWLGKYNLAMKELNRSEVLCEKAGSPQMKAFGDWLRGGIYRELGEWNLVHKTINFWFQVTPININKYTISNHELGLLYLQEGKMDSAKYRLNEIQDILLRVPTLRRGWENWVSYYYSLLQGEILLAENSPEAAIITCRQKSPSGYSFQFWRVGVAIRIIECRLTIMKDVLARAYYQNGNIDKAIEEYEKLTSFDPANRGRDLINPRYYYRLAKLYEEKGLSEKAIKGYQKFISLWKDADEIFPEKKGARDRLDKLKLRTKNDK